MPRAFLITAAFPPAASGASDQMGKRVKYLAKAGWRVDVVTPAIPGDTPVSTSVEALPQGVEVHRTGFLFQSTQSSLRHDKDRPRAAQRRFRGLTDLLFVPAGYLRWLPSAVRTGRKLASNVDVILSVSNPITTHLIARLIARRSGTPWIAELRDPLVGYSYSRRGPERLNRWFESWVVRHADGIVQWLDFVPKPVSDRHPAAADKMLAITHTGFDADDFIDYQHTAPVGAPLKICYTGSFYGGSITPVPFLQALGSYLAKPEAVDVEVTFAGDWSPDYETLVADLGLGHCVRYVGRIGRVECIDLWQRHHVLLLILGAAGDDVDRVPSKFWDYVATRTAILALVAPDGRLAELVRSENLGRVVPATDTTAIETAIASMAGDHIAGQLAARASDDFLLSATKQRGEALLSEFMRAQAAPYE